MVRLHGWLAALCAGVLTCVLGFAGEAPAPGAAPELKPAQEVPPFALAVLSFRELGNGLEKAGLYANQILPNSSALARQIAMTYLFSLPVDAGLKQDAPARVYLLDPRSSGVANERALALGVSDPVAVKTALIGAYGAPVEKDGVMTFTLPQELLEPDRTLLIKLAGDRLLAAPNVPVLEKLEAFEKAAPPLAATTDAALTLSVTRLRRSYGEHTEVGIESQLERYGSERVASEVMKLFDTFWQLEHLEILVRLDAKGDTGQLEINAFARPGSPVAQKFKQPGTVLSEQALKLVPEKSAFFAAWVVNGPEVFKLLQAQAGRAAAESPEDLKPFAHAFEKALIEGVAGVQGEVSLSLSGTDIRAPLVLASIDVASPEEGMAKASAVLEALYALANAQLKKQAGPAFQGDVLALKKGTGVVEGVAVTTFEIAPLAVTADERLDISELMGWPPVVRACVVEKKLILALGRESTEDLASAIARMKAPLVASDPSLRAVKDAVAGGSQAVASLTTLNAAKLIFARTALPPTTTLDRVLRGISDAPAVLSGRALNQFSLKLDLPSGAAHAFGSVWQRFSTARAAADANDPVPPPPPAP